MQINKIKCLECKKTLDYYPYQKDVKKFCSRKCFNKFRKGKPSTRKNYKHSSESRLKISLANIGKATWNKGTRKIYNKICPICKKEFNQTSHHKEVIACSAKCASNLRKNGKLLKCLNCGCEKYVSRVRLNKFKFCSRKCTGEYRRGERNHRWKGGYENTLILNKRRRARKFKNGGSHNLEEWNNLKKQYNYTCPCCKKQEPEIKLTEDHIIPLSKGGSDYIENIQPLCGHCNCKKQREIIKYKL